MKKVLSVCLSLMLLLACIPLQASADGTAVFAVGTAEAHAGETVSIPVMIENNPGIIAFRVTVSFDTDVLTLQSAAAADLLAAEKITFGGSYDTDSFRILWEDGTGSGNTTVSGTFATLEFLVKEDAPIGETTISINYSASSTFDYDLNEVAFGTRAGSVTVVPTEVGSWSFSEDCTLCTYEGNEGEQYIVGMDLAYPVISEYIETTGGWSYEIELNEFDMESTGAKLMIKDANDTVVEEYYTVLFGDINGDGVLDPTDTTILVYLMGNVLDEPWADFAVTDEYPQSFAADVNHDLVLDGSDASGIVYQMGDIDDIDQVIF